MSQQQVHGVKTPAWVSRVGRHRSWHFGRKLFLCEEQQRFDKRRACPPLVWAQLHQSLCTSKESVGTQPGEEGGGVTLISTVQFHLLLMLLSWSLVLPA